MHASVDLAKRTALREEDMRVTSLLQPTLREELAEPQRVLAGRSWRVVCVRAARVSMVSARRATARAHDKRSRLATLTQPGLRVLRDAATDHVADVEELFSSRLDADQLEQLATLLARLPGGAVSAVHPHPVRA